MSDWQARAAALELENERLRDRIAVLEDALGMTLEYPPTLPFSPSEGRILGLLLARGFATKQAIVTMLYDARPDDAADPKIVDVFICRIREKLKAFTDARIETKWGEGYFIPADDKPKLRAALEGKAA